LLELNCRLNERFNVNCFAAPPIGGFGSEARVDASLRSDGINNFDFALFKRTAITERAGIEFRFEFFKLFNHPQFGFPGTNFVSRSSNGFGTVTSQLNNPRLIQFALKFQF